MTAIQMVEPQQLSTEIESLQSQISELESDVSNRQQDINNLREAIKTIESNEPRPPSPSADDIFVLLRELVGAVPEQIEQRELYEARLEAARNSLELAEETCQHKSSTLQLLKAELREKLAEQLFQKLTEQARKFNENADENFALLEKMKELRNQITRLRGGTAPLNLYCEEREAMYCGISANAVTVQRRIDFPRG